MRVWHVIVFAVLVGTGVPVAIHYHEHGTVVPLQVALAFFYWLNTIIAVWEICLFLRISTIEIEHRRLIATHRGRELEVVRDFFSSRVPLARVLSPTLWSGVWSSYSVFDDSYANRRSFGFFVDIGNGFTTLVPSLLCLYGMTYAWLPARVLGLVGLVICWQMFYGTVVYLASFFFNRRHVGHSPLVIATIIGMSNGLWFAFPIVGMYASIGMIYTDSYALFR